MFKFERLEVWQKSIDLYEKVVDLTQNFDRSDQFSLGEQLRRALLSIPTNIAEGSGREGPREAKHFFNIAKGSVYEVVSLLYVAHRRRYLDGDSYQALYANCDELAKMLSGLLKK